MKKAIAPIADPLGRVLSLRGVRFEWKAPHRHGHRHGEQIGMIAQEVEQAFPAWVRTRPDGYKAITTEGFAGLAVEAIRELKRDNDQLRAANARLQRRLADIDRKIAALDKRLR